MFVFSFLEFSFNQLRFCPIAPWNPDGITFANQSIIGQDPRAIFVDTNNTVYAANRQAKQILIWDENSTNPTKIISGNFSNPNSLFVTSNGDIYIDNGEENNRVEKWTSNTNTFVTVMNVNSPCWGLFIDINDNLYCSMHAHHQVVKRSLKDPVMANTVVAGTGISGLAYNELNGPVGIFIDINLDLYVADCLNNRVLLFPLGQSIGITIAGFFSLKPTISLFRPTGIMLDSDRYLFIVDYKNSRIVGSGPNGFRCLVGCHGKGSESNQLLSPFTLSFDGAGNIFVIDEWNHRIQKFLILENSCGRLNVVKYFIG